MNNIKFLPQAKEIATEFMRTNRQLKGDPTPLSWTDPQDGIMTVVLTAGPKVTAAVPEAKAKRKPDPTPEPTPEPEPTAKSHKSNG